MANSPEDINRVDPSKPLKAIESGEEKQAPEMGKFASYMDPSSTQAQGIKPGAGTGSVYDVNAPTMQTGTPTVASIHSQMVVASGSLGDVQNQLNTKNLKLSAPQKYLLRNKLSDANTNLRSAAAKVGVDVGTPPSSFSRQNPVGKFLSLVNDGQRQMVEAQRKLADLSQNGGSMQPGEMLLVQVKLSQAQQNLEYSSVLLSKAIEDIKTLFNVQI